MLSQPAAPNSDDNPLKEQMRIGESRQEDASSSTDWSFQTEFEALRSLRERLKQSPNRPQWWSNHFQSFFR